MIPDTYKELKTHYCANCGTEFQSGSPHALYCTIRCQRSAKLKRRKSREQAAPTPEQADPRFFATVVNPTIAQLSRYAELLEEELTNGLPIRFQGNVPMFNPPQGISLVLQQKLDDLSPSEWLMFNDKSI